MSHNLEFCDSTDDVQDMKAEYEETCLAINDDDKHLHQFCDRLQYIFTFDMRGKLIIFL